LVKMRTVAVASGVGVAREAGAGELAEEGVVVGEQGSFVAE
jgi:hypothetical protein